MIETLIETLFVFRFLENTKIKNRKIEKLKNQQNQKMSKISVFAALTVSHREYDFRGLAAEGKKTKKQKKQKKTKRQNDRKKQKKKERTCNYTFQRVITRLQCVITRMWRSKITRRRRSDDGVCSVGRRTTNDETTNDERRTTNDERRTTNDEEEWRGEGNEEGGTRSRNKR